MASARTGSGTSFEVHGSAGRTIVLVHGLGLNKAMWQWQVPDLKVAGWQVVTYDLFGHGESAAPPQLPSLTLFSGQLAVLMDHLGITEAVVAGFSLGGMIARRFAMDHPARTTALVILHSAHLRDQAAHDAIQARVHQARKDGPGATVEAAIERWFTAPFRKAHPGIMDLVRQWVLTNDKDIYPSIYQVLVDGVTELAAPEPPVTCPALVMTGDEDYGNSVEMSRAIAAEIPGSETVILKGLRHMAMVEAPERFNAPLLQFLRTLGSKAA